jgi:hypothetical protein
MLRFEVREKLPSWADLPLFRVIQALTDALPRIGASSNVEQALISSRILHDGRSFPFHRKHHGALGSLELFQEGARPAAEGRQGLDVVRDVKHGTAPIKAPF